MLTATAKKKNTAHAKYVGSIIGVLSMAYELVETT